MRLWLHVSVFAIIVLNAYAFITDDDKPCAARHIPGKSVICVCNATYCDEVTRSIPANEEYIVYISSKAGSRFKKTKSKLETDSRVSRGLTLKLNCTKYQMIHGFGAAFTDSAGVNWRSLPGPVADQLINTYFSDKGIGYNLIRIPIGGTDFSTHNYAYNETPKKDLQLSNYSLTFEDHYYKIPMIKASRAASSTPVNLIASTWSPPSWMKEYTNYSTCGRLNKTYLQTYADYHLKFLELYYDEGISFWALTTTNEPSNGYFPKKAGNCLGWSATRMGLWISNYLGPLIRSSKFKSIKILAVDDQRFMIPMWFTEMVEEHPQLLKFIDGVAVHWYYDSETPPEFLEFVTQRHPDKFLLSTEACQGFKENQHPKVDLGSWDRAKSYVKDIITDLNLGLTGWIDWNICLNEEGGPTWNKNFVDSPVIVAAAKGEFYKQPMFYALGHFSKFLPRGSFRVNVTDDGHAKEIGVKYVAFLTPNDTVAVQIYNDGPPKTVSVQLKDKYAVVEMEEMSVATVEIRDDEYTTYCTPTANQQTTPENGVKKKCNVRV